MLADDLKKQFPKGATVPKDFRAFCAFAEEQGLEVSGCFELDADGRASLLVWFGGDEAAASQFAAFGRGPDGSIYAFWLHAGPDIAKAPVVRLDSECADNAVIAGDFRELLRLLAIGYEEPGKYPTLEPEDPESAEALREWIEEELGLFTPPDGEAIVTAAQAAHPDLAAWVRAWQEKRG